jgi:predicted N-acetyltransferase YhbS
MKDISIRQETNSDQTVITQIHNGAFCRKEEGMLVNLLRINYAFESQLSLVADSGSDIIGHILLFPIFIQTKLGRFPILSLGPIAVLPDFQELGIGGKLITQAHTIGKRLGYGASVVIGHPLYYPRFGYKIASLWGLSNPWKIHNEAFMAIEFTEGYLNDKAGICIYPDAYDIAT